MVDVIPARYVQPIDDSLYIHGSVASNTDQRLQCRTRILPIVPLVHPPPRLIIDTGGQAVDIALARKS